MDQYHCWLLLYAKMLKETETGETIVFFVKFLSLVAFQLRGAGPLATFMEKLPHVQMRMCIVHTMLNQSQQCGK